MVMANQHAWSVDACHQSAWLGLDSEPQLLPPLLANIAWVDLGMGILHIRLDE